MPDPCIQENNIGRLTATQEQISTTLERLLNVLDKVSAQGTRIDALMAGQDNLFGRMRDMEIKAEGEKVKVGMIMGGISMFTAAITSFVTSHLRGH